MKKHVVVICGGLTHPGMQVAHTQVGMDMGWKRQVHAATMGIIPGIPPCMVTPAGIAEEKPDLALKAQGSIQGL